MPARTWRTVNVAGLAGVPSDGSAGSVSVVATVAEIAAQGQLFGRPNDQSPSTLMGIYGGDDRQNTSFSAVVALSDDGTIQLQTESVARLVIDVQGYYTESDDGTAPGGFVPMNGNRIVDTRSGLGAAKSSLGNGASIDVQVTGAANIPVGASAAIVNLIAVNTLTNTGYLTPYASGTPRPLNSFNYAGSVATSMQAQVKLSPAGKLTIYNYGSITNLVIDIQGYFTATGAKGAVFTPATGRVFDSRTPEFGPLGKNETRAIQVAGRAGAPAMGSGITAAVLTLTSLATNGPGNATVWADGTSRPNTTSINFDDGTIRSNTITVPLGSNGKISLNNVADATNYVIDLQGWYFNATVPSIACPAPYSAGSWNAVVPTEEIICVVSAPIASTSDASTVISVDDVELDPLAMTGSVTSTEVYIAATAGAHRISARVGGGSIGSQADTNSYQFGLGDWSSKPLAPDLADGAFTPTSPSLSVSSTQNDDFAPGTQVRYRVSTSIAGLSVPEVDSDWLDGAFDVPQGTLAMNTTYYWQVDVRGPSGETGTVVSVRSPAWSFTTTDVDNVAWAEAACAEMADEAISAGQSGIDPATEQQVSCNETTVQLSQSTGDANLDAQVISPLSDKSSSFFRTAATGTTYAYNVETGMGVSLTGLDDDSAAAAVDSIQPKPTDDGAASEETGASRTDLARVAASTPGTGGLTGTYRVINSTYKETIGATLVYGLRREGKWLSRSTIQNKVVLNLGSYAYAKVSYSWASLSGRQITASIYPTLYRQNGYAAPSYLDAINLGPSSGPNYVFRTRYTDSGSLLFDRGAAKYHIEPRTLVVTDRLYNHRFTYYSAIGVGHRWQCYKTVVCKFPGGKEAGV
ncbi:hypothetical protein [Agromyces seonyuensis]|uniref:Uncharacterized protein n=1 Tax=Agromyces seonyuensis TaxID=2662446 RepID=A0A6I4P125_9MICO|nr:hypothetical protein [Agromyces seonyuensis]MWC00247.1 hypothetical protein [Agromyces seonyuensis]